MGNLDGYAEAPVVIAALREKLAAAESLLREATAGAVERACRVCGEPGHRHTISRNTVFMDGLRPTPETHPELFAEAGAVEETEGGE